MILFAVMKNQVTPRRILVVEDDALSREVFCLLLEHSGYVVETAASGDLAVRHLKETPGGVPDVVLADMQMPGIAGGALARELRHLCGPSTVLLAMSGRPPAEVATREFDGVLLKPFTMEQLTAAIASPGNGANRPCAGIARDITPFNEEILNEAILNESIYRKLHATMRREPLQQLYALCLMDAEERIARMGRAASNQDGRRFDRGTGHGC